MLPRTFIVLSCMLFAFGSCAKLLRKPKVYNAIITTDEQLTPSRAFPIIQPVIHPAVPFFSSLYPAGIYESGQNDLNDNKKLDRSHQEISAEERQGSNEKVSNSQIPLNEYGFPPALVPLHKVPVYPYIYDSYGNIQAIQQFPVLPPNFYPQNDDQKLPIIEQPLFSVRARKMHVDDASTSRSDKSHAVNENLLSTVPTETIKNNSNKNNDIPDVAIPPLPFSIKKD